MVEKNPKRSWEPVDAKLFGVVDKQALKNAASDVYDSIPAKPYIITSAITSAGSAALWGAEAGGETLAWSALFLALSKLKRRRWWKYALLFGAVGSYAGKLEPLLAASVGIVADILILAVQHTKTGLNEVHRDEH